MNPLIFLSFVALSVTDSKILPGQNDLHSRDISRRIVNGTKIIISEAPYIVSFHLEGIFFCGGVLISEDFVLTAGHCISKSLKMQVRIGSTSKKNGGILARVTDYKIHPKYEPRGNHANCDFALLRIDFDGKLPETAEIIKLPKNDETLIAGEVAFTAGWGYTGEKGDDHLRGLEVPILSEENCKNAYPRKITKYMLCAGYLEGGRDSCSGDSGGPLVRKSDKVLVGITSWGDGCAEPNKPGVYASVSSVRSWIKKIAKV